MQTDVQFQILIPAEHPCYADHFPGDTLVPGALLLKWIVREMEDRTHCEINNIKSIKFLTSVRPKHIMNVIVSQSAARPNSFNLECRVSDAIVIKGQMEYRNVLEKY
jgi:3-hydroxyacyl-[acyl-carrier-protein] dehydratase